MVLFASIMYEWWNGSLIFSQRKSVNFIKIDQNLSFLNFSVFQMLMDLFILNFNCSSMNLKNFLFNKNEKKNQIEFFFHVILSVR